MDEVSLALGAHNRVRVMYCATGFINDVHTLILVVRVMIRVIMVNNIFIQLGPYCGGRDAGCKVRS